MISKTFRWFLIIYLSFVIIGAFTLIFIEKGDWVIYLNQHRTFFLDSYFKYWTHLGDGFFVLFVLIVMLFVKYRYAVVFFTITVTQAIISLMLKRLVFSNAMRPKKYLADIYDLQFVPGVDVHSFHSFPSGHTMTAFSIAAFFALIANKRYTGILFFVYALLVGFSRNYLSQHFFEDIYVGSVLGVFLSLIVWRMFKNKEDSKWLDGSLRNKILN